MRILSNMAEEIFVIGTKDKQHKAKTAFS